MGAITASISISFDLPAHFLDGGAERAGFTVLGSFLLSFLFIRTSARLIRSPRVPWWPGSVTTDSGLHIHHLVWGIVLLLLSGFLSFAFAPVSPWNEILAAAFGIGAGLTLDEFALWVYLDDVYWSEQGRASLDAVIVATAIGGLLMLGFAPFDIPNDTASVDTLLAAVALSVALSAAAILKGKHFTGLIGLFIPPISFVGACRLAVPGSPYARRFYPVDSRKQARAESRFARVRARQRRIADAIAGAPETGTPTADGGESPTDGAA
jgi:hypothetical protein